MSTDAIPEALTDELLAEAVARRGQSPLAGREAQSAFRALYDRHARRLLAFLAVSSSRNYVAVRLVSCATCIRLRNA